MGALLLALLVGLWWALPKPQTPPPNEEGDTPEDDDSTES